MIKIGDMITMVDSYSMTELGAKVIYVIDDETVIVIDNANAPFKAVYDDVDDCWILLD